MPQTTVTSYARAYAGQVGEAHAPRYIRSARAEGSGLLPGQPALRGTDPAKQARAVEDGDTIDASTVLGWVVLETSRPVGGIADLDGASVLVKGVLYVEVSAAVTAGDLVFVGSTTATLGDIEGEAGTGLVPAPGAYFEESGEAGNLVLISVNVRKPLDTDTPPE